MRSWWMSWPLDQVLHQAGLTVLDKAVLPGFGSGHYPIEVAVCHKPTALTAPSLAPDDLEEAHAGIALARRGGVEER